MAVVISRVFKDSSKCSSSHAVDSEKRSPNSVLPSRAPVPNHTASFPTPDQQRKSNTSDTSKATVNVEQWLTESSLPRQCQKPFAELEDTSNICRAVIEHRNPPSSSVSALSSVRSDKIGGLSKDIWIEAGLASYSLLDAKSLREDASSTIVKSLVEKSIFDDCLTNIGELITTEDQEALIVDVKRHFDGLARFFVHDWEECDSVSSPRTSLASQNLKSHAPTSPSSSTNQTSENKESRTCFCHLLFSAPSEAIIQQIIRGELEQRRRRATEDCSQLTWESQINAVGDAIGQSVRRKHISDAERRAEDGELETALASSTLRQVCKVTPDQRDHERTPKVSAEDFGDHHVRAKVFTDAEEPTCITALGPRTNVPEALTDSSRSPVAGHSGDSADQHSLQSDDDSEKRSSNPKYQKKSTSGSKRWTLLNSYRFILDTFLHKDNKPRRESVEEEVEAPAPDFPVAHPCPDHRVRPTAKTLPRKDRPTSEQASETGNDDTSISDVYNPVGIRGAINDPSISSETGWLGVYVTPELCLPGTCNVHSRTPRGSSSRRMSEIPVQRRRQQVGEWEETMLSRSEKLTITLDEADTADAVAEEKRRRRSGRSTGDSRLREPRRERRKKSKER